MRAGVDASVPIGPDATAVLSSLSSTGHSAGASLVGVEDAGGRYTGTTVEAALTEVATSAALAATTNGNGASLVGIEDAGGLITATTVEGALAELAALKTRKFFSIAAQGGNGAGARTAGGARVGDVVVLVSDIGSNADASANFESTITVNDQIQQTGGDYSGGVATVLVSLRR